MSFVKIYYAVRKAAYLSATAAPSAFFCLYKNADETVLFLSHLYERADVVVVDFSALGEITAAAALALFAHVNNIQQGKGNAGCFVFQCKDSPLYKGLFVKGGLLNALRAGSKQPKGWFSFGSSASLPDLRTATFAQLEEFRADFAASSLFSHDEVEEFFMQLRQAVKEALLNITNHAYLDEKSDTVTEYDHYRDKMWWQMLWYLPEKRQVNFLIYDLGIGVVESYVRHATQERPATYRFRPTQEILKEALSPGMSRFVDAGRGNGWGFITAILDKMPGSHVFIRTNNVAGRFSQKQDTKWFIYKNGLDGTLVEWSFQLPHKDNQDD